MEDYNNYTMSLKEKIIYVLIAGLIIYITGFIFYRSHILSLMLMPIALLYPRIKRVDIIKKRKNELNIQFKDMLYSVSSSLTAGRSIELAFKDTLKDLSILYPASDTSIIKEVGYIVRKIEMNETVESALHDFAKRAHIDDIESFADVFSTCKRMGGNIIDIIRNSSNIINDKIEIKQEIETILAERKFEQKILNVLPLCMIVLLSLTAGDYIAPVFGTVIGRIVMSVAIILLAAAYFISKKIMSIEI